MGDEPFTWESLTWHRPRPSYDPMTRVLSADELATLTACEAVLEALTATQIAVWVCDLIAARDALDTTLHACMDQFHEAQREAQRHLERWQSCQERLRLAMKVDG